MKKVFLLILTFAYLATSSGASIYLHECMGKLASVDLGTNQQTNNTCDKCHMPKKDKNGCCQDQIIILKAAKDQVQPLSSSKIVPPIIAVQPPSFILINDGVVADHHTSQPLSQTVFRDWLQNTSSFFCCFLI